MKWLLTSKKSAQEIYELWNVNDKLLTLTVQLRSRSLRLAAADEQRVFLFEKKGLLRPRTVLRNEYGISIGQLVSENEQNLTGTMEFDQKKYNYSLQKGRHMQLMISIDDQVVARCELPVSDKNITEDHYELLILAFGWYSLSVVKKHAVEYA